MGWIITLLGLAASGAGGWAIFMGWPLVPLERGWTMVISGAALASGGLVCLALAVQIFETRRARLAIERGLTQLAAQLRESPVSRSAPPPSPLREAETNEAARPAPPPAMRPMPIEAPSAAPVTRPLLGEARPTQASEAAVADELQPARSFTVGGTTFVVFNDGSIEARTTEGTKRFDSMEEVRAYLETSVN